MLNWLWKLIDRYHRKWTSRAYLTKNGVIHITVISKKLPFLLIQESNIKVTHIGLYDPVKKTNEVSIKYPCN